MQYESVTVFLVWQSGYITGHARETLHDRVCICSCRAQLINTSTMIATEGWVTSGPGIEHTYNTNCNGRVKLTRQPILEVQHNNYTYFSVNTSMFTNIAGVASCTRVNTYVFIPILSTCLQLRHRSSLPTLFQTHRVYYQSTRTIKLVVTNQPITNRPNTTSCVSQVCTRVSLPWFKYV